MEVIKNILGVISEIMTVKVLHGTWHAIKVSINVNMIIIIVSINNHDTYVTAFKLQELSVCSFPLSPALLSGCKSK